MGASVLGDVQRERSPGIYRIATYVYALLAYLLLAGCAVGGVALILLTWVNPFAIAAGVVLLGIAYVAFPRPAEAPETVSRADFPVLYELADEVADALGAHRVDGIAIAPVFNASFGRYGWRSRRIMTLGLPLLTVLDGQERVALFAHEIGHDVNRDPLRGLFVRNALTILLDLYDFLQPQEASRGLANRGGNRVVAEVTLAGHIANAVLAFLSMLVRPFLWVFLVLVQRDSQRAEYLADAFAADVAGDDAARSMLRRSHLGRVYENLARGAAAQGDRADILGTLRRWVVDAPPSEWERIDRIMALEQTQLDVSHPPTSERIRFLTGRDPTTGRVAVESAVLDAIDRELKPLEQRFTHEYIEGAQARLYRN